MAGSSAAAWHRADDGSPERGLMSIGEVLAHLRADFPDVTISKLRFLEAEGLVEPRRTPAGYRKYAWVDVTRPRWGPRPPPPASPNTVSSPATYARTGPRRTGKSACSRSWLPR